MKKEQCHRLHHSRQDTEPVPYTDLLKMKSLDTTCSKTAWDNKLVSHQLYFSAFIKPKIHSLTTMPTLFSKEHLMYPGHIQIIWFVNETHLNHQKVT